MPLAVGYIGRAADGIFGCAARNAKSDAPIGDRNPKIAVVTVSVHIAIYNDIALDPVVAAGDTCRAGVVDERGFEPEFNSEIAANIRRDGGRVDLDFDAVNVVCAVAAEAQGISRRGGPRRGHA
jgi:hypothetical protein